MIEASQRSRDKGSNAVNMSGAPVSGDVCNGVFAYLHVCKFVNAEHGCVQACACVWGSRRQST